MKVKTDELLKTIKMIVSKKTSKKRIERREIANAQIFAKLFQRKPQKRGLKVRIVSLTYSFKGFSFKENLKKED